MGAPASSLQENKLLLFCSCAAQLAGKWGLGVMGVLGARVPRDCAQVTPTLAAIDQVTEGEERAGQRDFGSSRGELMHIRT